MRVASVQLVTAIPILAVVAGMLWVGVNERHGSNPLGAPPFRNSAEAAAAGDAAAVLRFLRMGDNPARIRAIRGDIISSGVRATTLEAAMWSRNIDMVRLLDREGAIVDREERPQLACLALDLDLPEVSNYLAADQVCARGVALERIIARSRPEVAERHD